jgi:hydrogenase large subunit
MDRDGGARGAGPTLLGHPVQVGPLAQVLVGLATGHKPTVTWTDRTLSAVSVIANLPISADALESTLGRHVARAIRTALIAERALKQWNLLVNNIARGDTATRNEPVFPAGEQRGFGLHEAPRGVLAHAVSIRNGRVDTYRVVLPSAWNAAPRGSAGEPGPCEAALVGNPVADTRRPLEVLRTVHSFDACAGCAIDVALEGTE